jgi:predicted CoA-binding protein
MASPVHQHIRDFLACSRIAIAGLSTDQDDFSCAIREKLEAAGFAVFGVNPKFEVDAERRNYPDLASIPGDPVEGVFVTAAPGAGLDVAKACKELGITRIWFHQNFGTGSVSREGAHFGRENGITVIERGCPMMFVEPVDWFHKTLRFCKGMRAVPNPLPTDP